MLAAKTMRKIQLIIFCILLPFFLNAQLLEPIKWSYSVKPTTSSEAEITITAKIDSGWHLYDLTMPSEDGPLPTTFSFQQLKGGKLIGGLKKKSPLITKFDEQFEMDLKWFENEAVFSQTVKIENKDEFQLNVEIRYMPCNDRQCLSPVTEVLKLTPKDVAAIQIASTKEEKKEENITASTTKSEVILPEIQDSISEEAAEINTLNPMISVSSGDSILWRPVIKELHGYGTPDLGKDTSWLLIFILGFGGGLIALLTPCVWPIIPMTVSFFLKRNQNKRKSIRQSLLYGLSIIVIYLTLGLLITALFGASALNEMSTNAVFNLLFFGLLVVFAISFFGAFDMALPSSWANKINNKADTTMGFLSIFFMAFTLVLVSFSCTGPIIGTLLVQAASLSSMIGPAVGMFGFALALSIPFTLFAIFPAWLKNLPKSGGWLNSVKVVLGFLELALALKFFSVADLAYHWNILDRETFLALWIVIFILLGFYLLGKIKFPHDSEQKHVSIPRFFMALISFSYAVYLIPGLWGAPLKSASAFLPPLNTQDFNLYQNAVHAKFDDYDAGMLYAHNNNKPVVVDFSGFGCVNCRKMEAAVWIDPKVKSLLEKDYVLITLFVDDKAKLPQPITVNDGGKTRTLQTVGDKWGFLQRHKFGANAQPFYVLLDTDGNPLAKSYEFNESIKEFISFLEGGLVEFEKRKK